MSEHVGGLGELPSAVGPSDQQQAQIREQWNTYGEIEYRLESNGIRPLGTPSIGIPEINPQLLQGLNDNQYTEIWAALDAWNSFIGETVSQLENIILQIENEMDDLRVHVHENSRRTAQVGKEKKPSNEELKFTVDSHPRFRFLKLELQKNKQHLNRLQARQKTLSRSERLLSRNIELIKSGRESGLGAGGGQRRASMPPRY